MASIRVFIGVCLLVLLISVEINVGASVNGGSGGWRVNFEMFWFVSQFSLELIKKLKYIVF